MNTHAPVAPSAHQDLIPVFSGEIAGQSVQLVDARLLHQFLESLQDFTNWIKNRIADYGFLEGQDYSIILSNRSDGKAGKRRTDYHLTLDMAKELSMVERNEKGRQARRYFIDCEKRLLQIAQSQPVPQLPKPKAIKSLYDLSYVKDLRHDPSTNANVAWWSFNRAGGQREMATTAAHQQGLKFVEETIQLAKAKPKDAEQAITWSLMKMMGGSVKGVGFYAAEMLFCEAVAKAAVAAFRDGFDPEAKPVKGKKAALPAPEPLEPTQELRAGLAEGKEARISFISTEELIQFARDKGFLDKVYFVD